MKRKQLHCLFVMLLGVSTLLQGDALTELEKVSKSFLPGTSSDQKKIFTTDVESKQEFLAKLQQEKNTLEEKVKEQTQALTTDLEETRSQIILAQDLFRKDPENELLKRKLASLNELYHLLKEIQQLWEQMIASVDQLIKLTSEYLQDYEFNAYKKELLAGIEKNPTFDDLQEIHQLILELDKRMDNLNEQERNAQTELENRKRSAQATVETFDLRKKEQDNALKQKARGVVGTEREPDELWDLQEKIFINKQKVDELKLSEIDHKVELIKLKLFITKVKRNVLKDLFRQVKANVQVSEADVAAVREEFEKKKQKAYADKRLYDFEIERNENEYRAHKQELEMLSKRYNITLDSELDKWSKAPKQTVNSFVGICDVGAENEELLYLARKKDYIKTNKDLVDAKIKHEEIVNRIKESFHKIRYAKFTPTELTQELKNYDMIKAGIKANISFYQERKSSAADLLETQKKASENIEQFRTGLFASKDTLFKDNPKEYNHCLMQLNNAREKIKEQIALISNIIGAYSDIVAMLTTTSKQIDFIVDELNSITIWYRPSYAVSWEGLRSLIPDLKHYFSDLLSYVLNLGPNTLTTRVKAMAENPKDIVYAFFKLLALILTSIGLWYTLPRLLRVLHEYDPSNIVVKMLFLLAAAIVRFFLRYYRGIALWSVTYLAFKFHIITDPYLHSIFYLASIAYLLYLAYQAIGYFVEFNRSNHYLFISREFEFRFTLICSGLVYSTIILYFFKKAFVLGNYSRSELPIILVAINFIILQIALIACITKDLLLSLIPKRGFGEWLYQKVDTYYYFILAGIIAIIILTNPYVGFGRLVLYVINKIIMTILLAIFLVWLYSISKRALGYVFFVTDEDEGGYGRFAHAKKWYGFSIIALFIFFICLGILLFAKVWSWPEQLASISHPTDIIELLQRPFSHVDQKPISIWVFLKLLTYIFGGLGLAYVFNHFVIGKIFDVLLIDPGVQNTVISITNYLFFALAVIIGFNAVGLASLLYVLLALVVGIGWIIKDPVSDFVAYFIILVQRPVKVGDLIRFDETEAPGVVRYITPRSVVLRRRNSTTIIIPNSVVINRTIINWNYARDFIAFDDILISIAYKSDTQLVRTILHQVLAESQYVLKTPRPIVRLDNFTENGYVFLVRGYLSSNYTLDQWDIASEIRFEIVVRLKTAGVEFGVPARLLIANDKKLQGMLE